MQGTQHHPRPPYTAPPDDQPEGRLRGRLLAGKIAQRRERRRQSYVYSRWGGIRRESVASFVLRGKA